MREEIWPCQTWDYVDVDHAALDQIHLNAAALLAVVAHSRHGWNVIPPLELHCPVAFLTRASCCVTSADDATRCPSRRREMSCWPPTWHAALAAIVSRDKCMSGPMLHAVSSIWCLPADRLDVGCRYRCHSAWCLSNSSSFVVLVILYINSFT